MLELTLVQLLVALCMSLGALCLFIWGVLAGAFNDVEYIKYVAYWKEANDEQSATRP